MGAIAGFFTLVLGLYSLGGGIYGYFAQDSMPSLIAGGISGLVLLLCSRYVRIKVVAGIALLVTGGLLYRFLPVFLDYKDWFPAGTMCVLAVPTALALLAYMIWGKKKPKKA